MEKDYHKKYYQKHKEHIKEQMKEWKVNNRERYNECIREWRRKNKGGAYMERQVKISKEWNKANKEQYCENVKRWRKSHPIEVKAQIAVSHAIRSGKIKRIPCEKCGDEKVEAHHPDYTKPLEVIFLCKKCHVAEHLKIRKLKEQEMDNITGLEDLKNGMRI